MRFIRCIVDFKKKDGLPHTVQFPHNINASSSWTDLWSDLLAVYLKEMIIRITQQGHSARLSWNVSVALHMPPPASLHWHLIRSSFSLGLASTISAHGLVVAWAIITCCWWICVCVHVPEAPATLCCCYDKWMRLSNGPLWVIPDWEGACHDWLTVWWLLPKIIKA